MVLISILRVVAIILFVVAVVVLTLEPFFLPNDTILGVESRITAVYLLLILLPSTGKRCASVVV